MSDFIMSLSDTSAGLSQVGGKGASLARLAAAGLPVPDGFRVTTAAYTQFVAANHLGAEITTALADIAPTQPASFDAAARRIWAAFEAGQPLPNLSERIPLRQAERQRYLKTTPPALLPEMLPAASTPGR